MISKVSVSKEISCKENPVCENFPEIIKFEGIKFPLTMVQKDQEKNQPQKIIIFFILNLLKMNHHHM